MKSTSFNIASTTISGSAALINNDAIPGMVNFNELKNAIASKGGTTEAALKILEKNDAFKNLLTEAINAAKVKSEELSK